MGIFGGKKKGQPSGNSAAGTTHSSDSGVTLIKPSVDNLPTGVVLTKSSGAVSLAKAQVYTIIALWNNKDYDLLVEPVFRREDGSTFSEWVSTYGTMDDPDNFSLRTTDGSVEHVTGDKTGSEFGGDVQPFEIIKIRLKPGTKLIRAVIVAYSAKKSGTGSFKDYGVSLFTLPGDFDEVPDNETIQRVGGKVVLAEDASDDELVYTSVPAVIHVDNNGGDIVTKIDPVDLYSSPNSENRPKYDAKRDAVVMDAGLENADKDD